MIEQELYEQNLRFLFGPIANLLDAHDVTEIMVNGPSRVYVERRGRIEATELRFDDREALMALVRGIAQFAGRTVTPEKPILEARLPDGSRLEAVIPPAAPGGPTLSIRRFQKSAMTLADVVARGSLRAEGAHLLWRLVQERRNILVAGGTGSGKTSLLNALASFIPKGERVIVIEDALELDLPHEHVVQLEARPPDTRGRGEITIRDLFRATLRLRPDRIVLGEIRGAEALELVQAMTSGHGGCLATLHATSPADALARLETMALMSDIALPLEALRSQIASAIDIVIQTARTGDGLRCVTEVAEVSLRERSYELRPIYESVKTGGSKHYEPQPVGGLP